MKQRKEKGLRVFGKAEVSQGVLKFRQVLLRWMVGTLEEIENHEKDSFLEV